MDSAFQSRVHQTFGSLGSSLPSWRLSDQQFHCNTWISGRHRSPSRDDTPCSSSFQQLSRSFPLSGPGHRPLFSLHGSCGYESPDRSQDDVDSDSYGLDCMDVEGQQAFRSAVARIEGSLENEEEEGRRMRQIVGLDTTLDFEDEEDEFDIAAVGREGDLKRIYMSEINASNVMVDKRDCLPLSFYDLKSAPRDPRANHLAARARLEEDAREASASCISFVSSEANGEQDCMVADRVEAALAKVKQILFPTNNFFVVDDEDKTVTGRKRSSSESEMQKTNSPRPPLEPSEKSQEKIKPVKRVRFALNPDQKCETPIRHKMDVKPGLPRIHPSRVPDHVRNPSKYTHYTLDWSNEDTEDSNLEAFKACAGMVRRNVKVESRGLELPQRIQFIPRLHKSSEAVQKSHMVEDDHSLTRPNKFAIYWDDSEPERESLGMSTCAPDTCESDENVVSKSFLKRTSVKGPKQYRSRKEASESEDPMET